MGRLHASVSFHFNSVSTKKKKSKSPEYFFSLIVSLIHKGPTQKLTIWDGEKKYKGAHF